MNTTFESLVADFDAAVQRSKLSNQEDLPESAHRRAGIRAVVESLRDEFDFDSNVWDQFSEILGGAGQKLEGEE